MLPNRLPKNTMNQTLGLLALMVMLFCTVWFWHKSSIVDSDLPLNIVKASYFLDRSDSLSVNDVVKIPLSDFTPLGKTTPFGTEHGSIWLKVTFDNPHNIKNEWVFSSGHYQVHQARVYDLTSDNQVIYDKNSASPNKLLHHQRHFAFTVELAAKQRKTLLINYHAHSFTHVHVNFQTVDQYLSDYQFRLSATVGVVAMLLLICIVNLLLFFALRERYHLFYVTQQIMAILLVLGDFGLIGADARVITVISQLLIANALIFVAHFLELKQRFIGAYQFINTAVCVLLFSLPLTYSDIAQGEYVQYILPLFIMTALTLPVYLGVRLYLRGFDYILPFLVSGIGLCVCLFLFLATVMDFVVIEIMPHYVFLHLAIVIEAVFLFISISMKINQSRQKQQHYYQSLKTVYQRQVSEAYELIEHANKVSEAKRQTLQKDKQLASTSHDIHHHLYLMKLNIANLQNVQQNESISALKQSVSYLQEVTEEILSVAKGNYFKNLQQFDLVPVIKMAHQNLASKADLKRIKLRWRCGGEIKMAGSQVLFTRILENLVNNAIEYTHQGGVLFTMRERKTHYVFAVYDTGNGISQAHLSELFDVFKRGDSMLNEGYGLGLYITSTLCHQAGYSLSVKSRKGRGTVFYVEIPK